MLERNIMVNAVGQIGWTYDPSADEWRLNDTGGGFDAVAKTLGDVLRFIAANL